MTLDTARLVRVREQRRRARERDRAERQRARLEAEAALAQQNAALAAALQRHDAEMRRIGALAGANACSGAELALWAGHLERDRAAIATERAACDSAQALLDMMKRDEDRARKLLNQARQGELRAESLHDEAQQEARRAALAATLLADDEFNSARQGAPRRC
jgi:hypothetical protein